MSGTEKVQLDDILSKFSALGRYHVTAVVYLTFINVYNAITYDNYVFITDEVKYRCNDSNHELNISSREPTCNNACSNWVYDDPRSFVAEFDLACEEWKRTLVGTMHCFGYMFGLLLVGPLSDRFGRKTMTVTTCFLGGIIGLAKSFITSYWLYIGFTFLEPLVGEPCSSTFMLTIEMVTTEKRVLYNTLNGFGYTMGGLLYPLLYWLIPYWRSFLRVVYGPALLFISYIFLLDESPRWLLTKGKKDKAVTILQKAAKMNKLQLEADINNVSYQEEKGATFSMALRNTFRSRTLMMRFFVCLSWWIASTFVNHGMTINSIFLQGNKYFNYALSMFLDAPSNLAVVYILNRFKRKLPLILSFMACAALCLGQPFVTDELPWLSITVYMSGKLMSTFYFSITYIFTSELFPTYTRNFMHALCSSLGRIGSISAQQMRLLVVYWSGLPAVIFGLVSLTAGLLTLLVPETAQDALPDTVCQAEALGQLEGNERKTKI